MFFHFSLSLRVKARSENSASDEIFISPFSKLINMKPGNSGCLTLTPEIYVRYLHLYKSLSVSDYRCSILPLAVNLKRVWQMNLGIVSPHAKNKLRLLTSRLVGGP